MAAPPGAAFSQETHPLIPGIIINEETVRLLALDEGQYSYPDPLEPVGPGERCLVRGILHGSLGKVENAHVIARSPYHQDLAGMAVHAQMYLLILAGKLWRASLKPFGEVPGGPPDRHPITQEVTDLLRSINPPTMTFFDIQEKMRLLQHWAINRPQNVGLLLENVHWVWDRNNFLDLAPTREHMIQLLHGASVELRAASVSGTVEHFRPPCEINANAPPIDAPMPHRSFRHGQDEGVHLTSADVAGCANIFSRQAAPVIELACLFPLSSYIRPNAEGEELLYFSEAHTHYHGITLPGRWSIIFIIVRFVYTCDINMPFAESAQRQRAMWLYHDAITSCRLFVRLVLICWFPEDVDQLLQDIDNYIFDPAAAQEQPAAVAAAESKDLSPNDMPAETTDRYWYRLAQIEIAAEERHAAILQKLADVHDYDSIEWLELIDELMKDEAEALDCFEKAKKACSDRMKCTPAAFFDPGAPRGALAAVFEWAIPAEKEDADWDEYGDADDDEESWPNAILSESRDTVGVEHESPQLRCSL